MRSRSKKWVEPGRRVLCLGNEQLADDACGQVVPEPFAQTGNRFVTYSGATGLGLLDQIVDVSELLGIDTIQTSAAKPGTVHFFYEDHLEVATRASSHCAGLLDAPAIGRRLGLPIPKNVFVVAVEAADLSTIRKAMHPGPSANSLDLWCV
jgi:hydrogenase maturation protease